MNKSAKTEEPNFCGKTWLNDLAEVEINNLIRDGYTLTPEQIVMIHELCKKTQTPAVKQISLTGTPRPLGNKTLYPFTIQSAEWYIWATENLPESLHVYALIFAHEHSRDENFFLDYYNPGKCEIELKVFSRNINATIAEAMDVLSLLNPDEKVSEETDQIDFNECIAKLVAETGVSPEVWNCRVSLSYILKQVDAINLKNGEGQHSLDYIESEKQLGLALLKIRKGGKNGKTD